MADDVGYGDVCAYSCEGGRTPNLDVLAAGGVRFNRGYVSASVCSPSRAGLLTGRYQQRFGHEFTVSGATVGGTSTGEVLLPRLLADRGYATGMVGKWHLGSGEGFQPLDRGFDEYFGFLRGANLYLEPLQGPGIHFIERDVNPSQRHRSDAGPILRGREPVEETSYLTEAFTREAVDFIGRHREQPFFLYLAYNAAHTPLQVTDKYYDRFPHIEDEASRIFAAMLSALDDGVGAVVNALRAAHLEENTLIVFLSDNGCATYTGACSNGPLLGGKLTHFEGGVRVPFLVRWPEAIKPGQVIDHPVSSLDVVPTVLEAVGGKPAEGRPLDGSSLLPLLHGGAAPVRNGLYWRNGLNWAALEEGRYKLVRLSDRLRFVFDLATDPGEAHDLSTSRPDLVERLERDSGAWSSRMSEPSWLPQRKVYLLLESLLRRQRRLDVTFEPRAGRVELTL